MCGILHFMVYNINRYIYIYNIYIYIIYIYNIYIYMGFTWIFFGIYDQQYGSMAMDQREMFTREFIGMGSKQLKDVYHLVMTFTEIAMERSTIL